MVSIFFSGTFWKVVGILGLLGGVWWILYERYFHPSWKKERRVLEACEKAFPDGEYEVVRIRRGHHGHVPSGVDFYPPPLGRPEIPDYFTYQINVPDGTEPDFSETTQSEERLIQHYLDREGTAEIHHGKDVVHPPNS